MADHFDSKTGADQNTPNTPARHRRVDRHKQLYQDIQRESENQPAAQDADAGLFGGSGSADVQHAADRGVAVLHIGHVLVVIRVIVGFDVGGSIAVLIGINNVVLGQCGRAHRERP